MGYLIPQVTEIMYSIFDENKYLKETQTKPVVISHFSVDVDVIVSTVLVINSQMKQSSISELVIIM